MNCREFLDHLSEYIDQDLDEELRADAQEHLHICQRCRAAVDTSQRIVVFCRQAYHADDLSPEQQKARRRWFNQALEAHQP